MTTRDGKACMDYGGKRKASMPTRKGVQRRNIPEGGPQSRRSGRKGKGRPPWREKVHWMVGKIKGGLRGKRP